jgi:hypothetical protein
MKFIYDLHKWMITENLILVYQGEFSQETTRSILAMAERTLERSAVEPAIKRKVFNVMVESLQNIVRHNEEPAPSNGNQTAIFLVGREPNGYSVMSGNPVRKGSVAGLKATLDRINGLDRDGLKDLYKDIIQGTSLSEKGGAGLGLVDMARKSGEKLSFDFPEMSEKYCFFCLKVNVSHQ